ncbi:MAG: ATP-binding protein [Nitrospirae bacterium]|nr:ATP-binding protein [Nitrospirota bacterium]
MIKPNWDIFKAKFSENRQATFEWFCYLLFCREVEKPFGILRYKNQSAIETDPVEKDEMVVGWQAKFYETTLSNHKDDLIGTVEKAKKGYPAINRVVLYTNQEWGQSKGTEPQGKKDVEAKAKELGIEIDWRTASFFESPFVAIDNEIIARHFFAIEKSIFDLIKEWQRHTGNILNEIQTNILFNGQIIELDRGTSIDKLKKNAERVIILSGTGGVGKTAVIKKLYEELEENTPFYVFKATEFELRHINDLFTNFSIQAFMDFHKEGAEKIVVIDSAEKLLDLRNTAPFKELLSLLISNNWKMIFTTRDNYLEDLNYQFFEIYKIVPANINIQNLEIADLVAIAEKFNFVLPKDGKLLDLIKNPFYLNEYLRFYNKDEEISYTEFKRNLWNKIIRKGKPAREQCFLQAAFERANEGQFFINPNCESRVLDDELKKDGLLGYESAGYFISHDIYEEWALEKIIEIAFSKKTSNKDFFNRIGSSRPIRRSFRNWLSEKLALETKEIKNLIEEVIKDAATESFWKDEMFVSVLLSEYSAAFFAIFSEELLSDKQDLLKKMTFLLRIACKEVDADFFKRLGVKDLDVLSLKYVFTKPKGQGWKVLIRFVFDNIDRIGIDNIFFILPVIHDWNSKFKEGETSRYSGLIALQYCKGIIEMKTYFPRDDTKDQILQTILYGAAEIENELKELLDSIIKNKWKYHRDPYFELSHAILTELEGITLCKILPKHALRLADLFWIHIPRKDERYYSDIGVEKYFGMESDHLDYFPASSYRTPIYWLLQVALIDTIDFILEFTNKTVGLFAKTEFAKHEVKEAEIFIGQGKPSKQFISTRLWCTYRGTQVSPHVLESMHMALEKFFLENGKNTDSKALESWLIYLLSKAKSASISGVVASIVLAYPEKTFNVAEILFKTKEFFLYDTERLVLDQTQKSSLLSLQNLGTLPKNQMHEDERLQACDDKHRQKALEHQFLNYQFFISEGTSEAEADRRQKALWAILDKYYAELPKASEETEADKVWKLYLARMDRRKMNPTTQKTDEGIIINFNPELEPELKEYSEKSLERSNEPRKYISLYLWAHNKLRNDEQYKQYEEYEKYPKLAFTQTQEIVARLRAMREPKAGDLQYAEDDNSFYLFNRSIPADACAVLLRDYFEILSKEEAKFCKEIILEYAKQFAQPHYTYQISDGSQAAFMVLPILFREFPEEGEIIKTILLLGSFDDYPVGMGGSSRFGAFSIMAIHKLWENNFEDAQSLLFGYLLLKPEYDRLREIIRKENYGREIYRVEENEITERLLRECEIAIQKVIDSKVTAEELGDIRALNLRILRTAFQLVPLKTSNKDHKAIVTEIISAFAEQIFSRDRDDKVDYEVKRDFLEKLAYFVLSCQKEDIADYLKPILDKFNGSEPIADLFERFITAEDYLNAYENFWDVWNLFKTKVIELCKHGDRYWYVDKIVKSYLFAQNPWKETAVEWHTLKEGDKRFFKEMADEIGHCPSALYAITKLLNDIGSPYLDDGVAWIADMLRKNKEWMDSRIQDDIIYYLEHVIRKYIYKNRERIKKTAKLKQDTLIILDSLIERSSVVGYILRETIL